MIGDTALVFGWLLEPYTTGQGRDLIQVVARRRGGITRKGH